MRRGRTSWFLFFCCLWILLSCENPSHDAESSEAQERSSVETAPKQLAGSTENAQERTAPKRAYDLLLQVQQRQGEPPPGYVGGREFRNRERRLPKGQYREYDLNPKIQGRPRDAERIVIEQKTGKAYYTGDHYRSFIPLE
jgi:ribonuclease T1